MLVKGIKPIYTPLPYRSMDKRQEFQNTEKQITFLSDNPINRLAVVKKPVSFKGSMTQDEFNLYKQYEGLKENQGVIVIGRREEAAIQMVRDALPENYHDDIKFIKNIFTPNYIAIAKEKGINDEEAYPVFYSLSGTAVIDSEYLSDKKNSKQQTNSLTNIMLNNTFIRFFHDIQKGNPFDLATKVLGEKYTVSNNTSFALGETTEKSKTKADLLPPNEDDVRYTDVGGLDTKLKEIREVIEAPMKNFEIFQYMGVKPHRKVLLYGPPGTGKTLIAKAIANEVGAAFIPVSTPELQDKFVGETEKNLREIFDKAKKMQPAVIFFDEIDALTTKRHDGVNNYKNDTVNQFLTLLDGFHSDKDNIFVIAATNKKDLMDPAILRKGRFDYHIEIPKPDKEGVKKILQIHIDKKPVSQDFKDNHFEEFATKLYDKGLTGSDIAFISNEAAYNCLRRNGVFDKILSNKEAVEIDHSNLLIENEDFEKALKSQYSSNDDKGRAVVKGFNLSIPKTDEEAEANEYEAVAKYKS